MKEFKQAITLEKTPGQLDCFRAKRKEPSLNGNKSRMLSRTLLPPKTES
jgi:hypothetical protein